MKNIWVVILLFAVSLQAQWVDDPAVNTIISSAAGAQYVPKVAVTPNGSYFFSWYGGVSNLNMNLSFLSHDGIHMWDPQEMAVSTHPQNTWIDDYSMVSDLEGNAIVVFSDIRNGTKDVVAYKIDQDGNQLWGEDGIVFPLSGSEEYQPNVIVTSDNNAVVLFSTNYSNGDINKIFAHKILADGTLAWGPLGKSFGGAFKDWTLPTGMANNDGGFSFGFFIETGNFPATVRNIGMIRCGADGNQLWSGATEVTTTGGMSPWDDLFCMSDENGGAYFVWKDDRYFDNMAETYAQHINGDGVAQWLENGQVVSTQTGFFQFYGLPVGVNVAGEFVVMWNKVNSNQSSGALMYQRISPAGDLLETNSGKTILSFSTQMQNGIRGVQMGDTTFFLYTYFQEGSSLYTTYNMIALDKNGNALWPEPVELTNSQLDRTHACMSDFHSYQAVVCWEDNMNGNNRTVAQNIFIDGALGSSTVNVSDLDQAHESIYFLTYQNETKSILFKNLEKNDILNLYNTQGQLVYRDRAREITAIDHLSNGMLIGSLIRNGKVIEHFKMVK